MCKTGRKAWTAMCMYQKNNTLYSIKIFLEIPEITPNVIMVELDKNTDSEAVKSQQGRFFCKEVNTVIEQKQGFRNKLC